MSPIPSEIVTFLEKQTCASVCCVDEQGNPYSFSCFYALNNKEGLLYYKSSSTTQHSKILQRNTIVSGTILPDKLKKMLVQGVQFTGRLIAAGEPLTRNAGATYHFRFPFALAMPGEVWTIELETIKMTDSGKAFGKKTTWKRTAVAETA
ncbi:hypothetical protein [Niabella aquatica]